MAKSARRHYRAAQKAPLQRSSGGFFAPAAHRPRLIAALIFAAVFVFLNGILTGWFLGKKK